MIQETFDSTKTPLNDILKQIDEGKTQLPDFQRGWIWDDERVKGLLASIAVSYPIGAIMLLEAGNPEVKFKPRHIEGVVLKNNKDPEFFILDGQQRLTTLYQTLYSNSIVKTKDTRGRDITRWYYFDIGKSLRNQSDIIDSIISLQQDKKITRDFGREIMFSCETGELEFRNIVFPVNQLLNSTDWFNKYMAYWNYSQEKIKLFQAFQSLVIKRFETYQIPVIKMFKHNPKDAICQVFEKVNTGGVSLNVFELLTATFAAENFNLREDWAKHQKRLKEIDVISGIENSDFLQVLSLYTTYTRRKDLEAQGVSADNLPAISCKRKDVLKLSLNDYQKWAEISINGFIEAGKILTKNKIFKSRDLPYTTQLIPLSVIIGVLKEKAEPEGVRQRILRWYWNGILGELYGGANETRFAKDVPEVIDWINGGEEPSTIRDAYFAEDRLFTLRTRNSAAYKGIFILQMQKGARDFRTGDTVEWQNYFDDIIDIHHIFPQKWCDDNKIDSNIYNSIINKTPLSSKTNRMIGGRAPSLYLETMRKNAEIDSERMNQILGSHFIEESCLNNNDFFGFIKARKEALIKEIERITSKSVQRSQDI